jgi:hypothetical protein
VQSENLESFIAIAVQKAQPAAAACWQERVLWRKKMACVAVFILLQRSHIQAKLVSLHAEYFVVILAAFV